MSRRKRPSNSRGVARNWPDAEPDRPWASPPRPSKWLLAGAVLLQAAWVGFLLTMAFRG